MRFYTVDGLPIDHEQATPAKSEHSDSAPNGDTTSRDQQLILLYRLFLQLHHAGSNSMTVDALVKGADGRMRYSHTSSHSPLSALDSPSSVGQPNPASVWSVGRLATLGGEGHGSTPYPFFWAPSAELPPGRMWRGFSDESSPATASAVPNTSIASLSNPSSHQALMEEGNQMDGATHAGGGPHHHTPKGHRGFALLEGIADSNVELRHNTNRCANGAEEIPVRCSLLSRAGNTAPPPTHGSSSPQHEGHHGHHALHGGEDAQGDMGSTNGDGPNPGARRTNLWSLAELVMETSQRTMSCIPVEMPCCSPLEKKYSGDHSSVLFCCQTETR